MTVAASIAGRPIPSLRAGPRCSTARRARSAAPAASPSRRRSMPPGSTRSTTRRTRTPRIARPIAERCGDEWSQWDEPAGQAGLVRAAPGGHCEVSLLLEGIHCGACVWLIESWLARQPGVVQASVNFATRRARVVWDPARDAAVAAAARDRRDRLSRVSVRSGAARGARARRVARAAPAPRRRAARDDAGDDVRGADLRHGRRRRARAPAAARMGEPHADAAGDPLLGGAVLPRRLARSPASAPGHGRAGRARASPRRSPRAPGRRSRRRARSTTIR